MEKEVLMGQVPGAFQALQKVSQMDFPFKTSYWLARNLKIVAKEAQTIEETRLKIFSKYGKPDEKGMIRIPPDHPNFKEVQKELMEYLSTKIKIDVFPIKLEMFGDTSVSAQDILTLDFLIDDSTEEK